MEEKKNHKCRVPRPLPDQLATTLSLGASEVHRQVLARATCSPFGGGSRLGGQRLWAKGSLGRRLLGQVPYSTQSSRPAPWWQASATSDLREERGLDPPDGAGCLACFGEIPMKGLEWSLAWASTIQACAPLPKKSSVCSRALTLGSHLPGSKSQLCPLRV